MQWERQSSRAAAIVILTHVWPAFVFVGRVVPLEEITRLLCSLLGHRIYHVNGAYFTNRWARWIYYIIMLTQRRQKGLQQHAQANEATSKEAHQAHILNNINNNKKHSIMNVLITILCRAIFNTHTHTHRYTGTHRAEIKRELRAGKGVNSPWKVARIEWWVATRS